MKKSILTIGLLSLCFGLAAVSANTKVVHAGVFDGDAWNYLGGWQLNSTFTDQGVEVVVPGADTVEGNAWQYGAFINNNQEWADLQGEFSIKDGKRVVVEVSVVFCNEDNSLIGQSVNGSGLYFIVMDAANETIIESLKVWTDAGGYGNGDHSYQLYAEDGNWTDYSNGSWVKGTAKASGKFTLAFDAENYLMSYVGGQDDLVRLASNDFYSHVGGNCAAENIKFRIKGDNGFAKDTKIILRTINGNSLARQIVYHTVTVDGVEQQVEDGTLADIEQPTREHYEFDKWVDGDGNEVDLTQPITADIEIFASWTPVKYSVKFGEGQAQDLDYDSVIDIPDGPEKEADAQYTYTFDGWYDGDNKLEEGAKVTKDVVFEPRYTQAVNKYDVTFGEATVKLAYGTTITAPEGPAKDADEQYVYTFKGWYDADGVKFEEGTTVTKAVVYHAEYDREEKAQPFVEPQSQPQSEQPSVQPSVAPSVEPSEQPSAQEEPTSNPVEDAKKGCKGEAATSLIGLITLVGALLLKKRR